MSDFDVQALSRCYGRAFSDCALVVPGVNRTYRLAAGDGVYYLRLYRPSGRSDAEIAFEMRLLREVRPIPGIAVAHPIRTADNADCTRVLFDGVGRTAGLFQALDGRPISDDLEEMTLFGSALAKLHGALAGIDGGERPLDPATLCARASASLMGIPGSGTVRRAIARCRAEMRGDPAMRGLPSGNCHGDARLANAVIRDGTVGFFDFDDCGHGPYLLDLGTAAWHVVLGDPTRTGARLNALLKGYERERPLCRAERRVLPHFVKLADVRALTFLAESCTLSDMLWLRVLDRSTKLLDSRLVI